MRYDVFLDLDRVRVSDMLREVRRFKRRFRLPKAEVRVSNEAKRLRNYHVIWWKVCLSHEEVRAIIRQSKLTDKRFIDCAEKFKCSVLRTAASKRKAPVRTWGYV